MSDLNYTDGYFGAEREISVAPSISYPFGGNPIPDTYHRRRARQFRVATRSFVPRIASRTSYANVVSQSNNYGTGWTQADVTVVPDYGIAPWDGSQSVDLIIETATTAQHAVGAPVTYIAAQYCMWAVAKAVPGRDWCALTSNASAQYYFNLATGEAGSAINCTARPAVALGDGYYLISAYFTASAGASTFNFYLTTGNGALAFYLGNIGTGVYLAQMQVNLGTSPAPLIITAGAARTISSPDLDSLANSAGADTDPFAFLVGESDLTIESSVSAMFSRLYARIPAAQIFPGAKYITRPVLHDIKSGTAYAVSFDAEKRFSWIFTSRKSVSSLTAPVVADDVQTNTKATLPGGITINLAGHNGATGTTGSFSTSDSIATIQTAVFNIWTHATVSVSKDAYGITVESVYSGSGGGAITQVDGSGSSAIKVSGSPLRFTIEASAAGATVSTPLDDSIRNVHAVAHGGAVGHRVALWRGDRLVAMGTVVTVPGADDFTVNLDTLPGKNEVVTHCGFSANAASCVVNGTIMCSIRRTQRYYLPGVSLGITTAADIPIAPAQQDPISWLAAIIAGSAWTVESVGDLVAAIGPILMQETIEVQMADAIDTVTP